jgi:DNA-binding CsgD family transcriptional regulator
LVLRGEAGIGKSALLDYLADNAPGCRIARTAGVESEMELAFAGLQQLCSPLLHGLERLPGPQRTALSTAFGLSTGVPPDPFFVGLATLSLLCAVGEDEPLLCLVDDAQWLDSASAMTLAFVARRLLAEPVGLVFAVREPAPEPTLRGFPDLPVRGLEHADARAVLGTALRAPLEPAVQDGILAEARGNPLALLELPRTVTPAELAFGFARPGATPLLGRIEQDFLQRILALPPDSRRLLVTAAVEPVGDAPLLWRAAERLGVGVGATAPAEAAGLIDSGARVRFRHPLVRSAACQSASGSELREVHLALAESTDPELAPDRRAWHLAFAATGPDESVAAELERSATRAQARGGLAAAAAFLERACELTPDPARRASRILAAAQARHQSGASEAASALLASAELEPLDGLHRARVKVLSAQIAFASSSGRDAPPLLLAAARQLEPLDVALSRDAYRDALSAAIFVGRLARDGGVVEVADAAARAPRPASGGPTELLLDGFATVITKGFAAGTPLLRRAVESICTEGLSEAESIRWLWLATHAAHDVWDDESWEVLSTRHLSLARQVGALMMMPLALSARIGLHLYAGELVEATALVQEIETVIEVTGNRLPPYGALALAARQGREAEATALIRSAREELVPRGEGMGLTLVEHAEAVLHNGLGQYPAAMSAAMRGAAHPQELGFATWCLVELVEAAARSGERAVAADALERLSLTTRPSGTDWAIGIEARCRALMSSDDDAESRHQEAIHHLGRSRIRMELARAHLLYGEWLRRIGRRTDARNELRAAHQFFTEMGVHGYAERARRELQATGETVRKRNVGTVDQLTAQEAQIARLAREGRTNPEIGALLFLSPRTVEWHLRKVFMKLGVSSRRELWKAERADESARSMPG